MISIQKIGNVTNERIVELVGLSTDEKPIDVIDGVKIFNGSTFLEMDTSWVYIYDAENHRWLDV